MSAHAAHHRLRGSAAVHALRHVPADVPDLRHDEARAQQPARPHRADARRRRRRPRGHARVRRGDELLPGLPGLSDGVPGRRRTTPSSSRRRGATSSARASIPAQRGNSGARMTLRFLFKRPRALRAAARALRLYQRSGLEGLVRRSGAIGLLPASLRRLEPQAPRVAAVFSNGLIARTRAARVSREVSRGAADGLRAGSRLSGRESRHGRRAARQRLRRRHAAAPAVLRLAARAQRRHGQCARACAADDRLAAA